MGKRRQIRVRRGRSALVLLAGAMLASLLPATPAAAAPANDSFVDAEIISGVSATLNGSNVGATKEPGEPNHAGDLGGSSIWYRWVAPSSDTVTIDTVNSSFDTLLGVYTGGSVSSLNEIASSDDMSPGLSASKVTFEALSQTTYHIAVDGFRTVGTAEAGNVVLRFNSPPVNDNFAGAQIVTQPTPGQPVTVNGYSIGATKEALEPKHVGNPGGSSVWYRWTPASDRTVTIDTFGSDFDTMLAIYTGANYGSLALVTSNDDLVGAGFTSRVRFSVFAGTTYQIAVDGFNGATGNVVLRLEPDRVDTAITSGPSGIMSSTSATFNFAASEPGSTFECSLNGAPFTSCVLPQKYTALAEQNYEFRVRAIDRGGRVDDTPATRAWTVDLTAPDTTIVSTPSGAVSSTSASFSFTSSQAGSTFQCALDNASFAYCISPTSFAGLSQGVHAFQVRAVDPAGNQDLSPASVSWTVDSIAPANVSIDDPTIGETYQLATAFPVAWSGIDSSSGLADFDVSLRQGSYGQPLGSNTAWYNATTASGAAFSGVPGYTYCFSVRARDNAGNLSPTSADRCTAIPLDDTAFARKGSWSVKTGAGYYLNTYTSSAAKGASLTLPGLKAKRLALVATTCSTCGAVKVIWDGVVTGTISLTSSNTKKMQLISLAEFGSMKEGTLTLKTTSSKKVIVEGLGVSKV